MTKSGRYPVPSAALDDRLGWIGTSGSGKTYNAGAGVEQLLAAGARVVIIDPLDVWWGLRLSGDGRRPGFPLVILGGAHADLPLAEGHGALIGETVATMRESCIVSLGSLTTKASERRFMLAFLDAIYRRADPARHDPFHIVFDEADLWAPQRSSEPQLQARMEEIVRRGRIKGFIPWLITQRPAVLSKDVLSQVDGLVAFKLTSSQDRDAIGSWIEGQADRVQGREILASLPTMQRGQGVVWIPGRAILETVSFPEKATFDSSRTPERNERRRTTATLKPLDLGALKERLASVEAEAKATDPKALKAEITKLKLELAAKAKAPTLEVPPANGAEASAAALRAAWRDGERAGIAVGIARAQQAVAALRVDGGVAKPNRSAPARTAPAAPQAPVARPAEGVTGPQQRILDALAWWAAFGINRPSAEQVAFMSGYAPSSGGFKNPRSELRTLQHIEYPSPGAISLSASGSILANKPDAPSSVEELHRRVMDRLSGPQRANLSPVLSRHPDAMAADDLAAAAGYSPTSGGFKNPRSELKTLHLIDYPSPGHIRAADWLFPASEHAP